MKLLFFLRAFFPLHLFFTMLYFSYKGGESDDRPENIISYVEYANADS